jgi:hypothetical protein
MKDPELSLLPMGRATESERQREIIVEHDAIPHQTEIYVNRLVLISERGNGDHLRTHHPTVTAGPNALHTSLHILPPALHSSVLRGIFEIHPPRSSRPPRVHSQSHTAY